MTRSTTTTGIHGNPVGESPCDWERSIFSFMAIIFVPFCGLPGGSNSGDASRYDRRSDVSRYDRRLRYSGSALSALVITYTTCKYHWLPAVTCKHQEQILHEGRKDFFFKMKTPLDISVIHGTDRENVSSVQSYIKNRSQSTHILHTQDVNLPQVVQSRLN